MLVLLFAMIAEIFLNHGKLQPENATCNMSLATCNEFFSKVGTQVAKKIAPCNTSCRVGSTFCNDCRDSLKQLQVAARDCTV